MTDCIFCKIGKGDIPAHKVYEDEHCLAFLDIQPHAKGHTVVIPKKHAVTATDIDENGMKNLFAGVKKAILRIEKVLHPDGFNVGWNSGSVAGQVVPHLHIHIMPRYINDGGGSMHSIIKNPGAESVDAVAKKFK